MTHYLKLKSREVDLRAMENEQKEDEADQSKSKILTEVKIDASARELAEDKMDQNEELARITCWSKSCKARCTIMLKLW